MSGNGFRIECEAPEGAPKGGKRAVARGVAYAGGKMSIFGWGHPIVVDLDGLECAGAVPLLANHENHTSARLGLVTPAKADGALTVEGEIVADTEAAGEIVRQARAGAAWQLSIGAEVFAAELVEEGARVVNGAERAAPFYHVTKAALREVSVVAVGADANTSMEIAAAATFHVVGAFEEPKAAAARGAEPPAVDWEARYRGLQAAKDREVEAARKDFREAERNLAQAKARAEQLAAELGESRDALAQAKAELAEERARYRELTGRALRPAGDGAQNWCEAVDWLGYAEACKRFPNLRPAVGAKR